MSDSSRLKVVLYWHMHQPQYRNSATGSYELPWTYLHAMKDYIDMAAFIEASPGASAVVNFAPILLEQIEDYAEQVRHCLDNGTAIRDPLLAALESPVLPAKNDEKLALITACLRVNRERLIDPFPAYRKLADMAGWLIKAPETLDYVSEQYLVDILVWYHLAWMGETVRRDNPQVKQLLNKGSGFNMHDRRVLLGVIGELLNQVLPRYRRLAEEGRVELSMSPYAHPILPLLLDFGSAREAIPQVRLPNQPDYPGGVERLRWHMREGIETFRRCFGFPPKGCWPSEGGVSDAILPFMEEFGIEWIASGERVLRNSRASSGTLQDGACLHFPYRVNGGETTLFFRDDGLSDLIGFTYATWHADDAVNNLCHHLENIADACPDRANAVVPIIMDGENAWEYYPENGYHFLRTLYHKLANHPTLELTTFSKCIASGAKPVVLDKLVAGSWVYGTFSTWIGDDDKNRGWDLLCAAKRTFDSAVASGRLSGERLKKAERQLAICEGSDWFWWFGDYNPSDSVSDFERLYRMHLTNLYQLMGEEPPEALSHVISHGGGRPEKGGVMRHSAEQA